MTQWDQLAQLDLFFSISGAPSVTRIIPEDGIRGVTKGTFSYFFVEALSYPAPVFQWKRIFANGTSINIPSQSYGNLSNLTISYIKYEDFGRYSVSAHNEIGRWKDVMFELRDSAMTSND